MRDNLKNTDFLKNTDIEKTLLLGSWTENKRKCEYFIVIKKQHKVMYEKNVMIIKSDTR